jgi:hypothetical protein
MPVRTCCADANVAGEHPMPRSQPLRVHHCLTMNRLDQGQVAPHYSGDSGSGLIDQSSGHVRRSMVCWGTASVTRAWASSTPSENRVPRKSTLPSNVQPPN